MCYYIHANYRVFFTEVLLINMGITKKVWIDYRDKIELKEPIVIVGTSGLRSVGKLVVDELVEKMRPRLFAELYSYGFPSVYYGPSYIGAPCGAGVKIEEGGVTELPSVKFYAIENQKQDIIIVSGYQAYDSLNQYAVAEKSSDLFNAYHVKKVIALGAQVIEEGIRCCATDLELLAEMHKFGIERTNVDRFLGFSGLVVAMGRAKGLKGVCLFASTTQNLQNSEYPDYNAVTELLEKVSEVVGFEIDTSDLKKKSSKEKQQMDETGMLDEQQENEETREQESDYLRGYV